MSSLGIMASQAFSPNKLAGLTLWLDASDIGTISEASNKVSEWRDKSVLGNHAEQIIGTAQPTTNVNTMNGRNVITYDGTTSKMVITRDSSINDLFSGGGSTFVAANPIGIGEGNFGRLFEKGAETRNYIRDLEAGLVEYAYIDEYSVSRGLYTTNAAIIIIGVGNIIGMLYDNNVTNTTPVFRINRLVQPTIIREVPNGDLMSDVNNDLVIGNRSNSDRAWDGYFGEILMYDRILDAGEIDVLEGYLSSKWGVS